MTDSSVSTRTRTAIFRQACTCAMIMISVGLISSCNKPATINAFKEQLSLIGSWELKSIEWITADTSYVISDAQPGIFMIDSARYSTMWTPTREPRISFQNLSNPSEDEILSGFRSVVFNAGTHIITDSTLVTTASIAKVPGFEGGKQYYRYTIHDDEMDLTMFDETYPDGSKPDWAGIYVTKFRMIRAR